MNKKPVHPTKLESSLTVKLQTENDKLKAKVLSLENKVLKMENKNLKLEHKNLLLQEEIDKLHKSPPKIDPVDLSKFISEIRDARDHK